MGSEKMNVLSLFDGISCGQLALQRANIPYEKYYASEIDKCAIKITQHHFPNTIQLGDIQNWRNWELDWSKIDLLMGGSPCQGFSFAGKGLAFDDPRSKLFFTFVDIKNHIQQYNPNLKFLLENVRMKKDYLKIISEYMGVEPVLINSALVSAQSRKRFYWANWAITQPEDKNIYLKDILDHNPTEIYKLYPIDKTYQNKKKQSDIKNRPKMIAKLANVKYSIRARVWDINYKSPNVIIGHRDSRPKIIADSDNARMLSLNELEKLQTLPVGYTDLCAKSRRLDVIGNGWAVDVITHILKELYGNK